MSGHSPEEIKASVGLYIKVFASLAVLTCVTVAVSYIEMSLAPTVAVALFIAAIKAGLVAMFFMHLKGEVRSIYRTLALTAIFFLFLMILPMAHLTDHIGERVVVDSPHAPAHDDEAQH